MNEISMKIYCLSCNIDDFLEYMKSIDGVEDVVIDLDCEEVYVRYDCSIIDLNILKKEILLFLGVGGVPSIDGFDRHLNRELNEYLLIIRNLCCEYCLRGMVDDLMMIAGIGKVKHSYNGGNKKNVKMYIYYDSRFISEMDLFDIENNFNMED